MFVVADVFTGVGVVAQITAIDHVGSAIWVVEYEAVFGVTHAAGPMATAAGVLGRSIVEPTDGNGLAFVDLFHQEVCRSIRDEIGL